MLYAVQYTKQSAVAKGGNTRIQLDGRLVDISQVPAIFGGQSSFNAKSHAENDDTNPLIQVPEGTAGSMTFIESTYGDLSDRQSVKSLQVSGRRVTAVAWCVFVL